ncbi:MAG: hypothetical protein OEV44_06165 [Spirochaetota bacterium]|nr:hypothetical protein [Spirochaetota bacterium]
MFNSKNELKTKLEYELKLIELIVSSTRILEIEKETIYYDGKKFNHQMTLESDYCQYVKDEIIESMMPMIFISSYKLLDGIFEWILEENLNAEKNLTENNKTIQVNKIPFQFSRKINLIKDNYDKLKYPFAKNINFLKDYLFALYKKLCDYRNEIVHGDNFKVGNKVLTINDIKNNNINITLKELEAFMRLLIEITRLFTGVESLDNLKLNQIKNCLDIIENIHQLNKFNINNFKFVNVIYEIHNKENDSFIANIGNVKKHFEAEESLGIKVLFNLKIIGLINNKTCISWYFPIDYVPKENELYLSSDSYRSYQR